MLRVLQLVHLSSPFLFGACSLKQELHTSGETDIQWVSKWLTLSCVMSLRMSAGKDWFCRFCKEAVVMQSCCYENTHKNDRSAE